MTQTVRLASGDAITVVNREAAVWLCVGAELRRLSAADLVRLSDVLHTAALKQLAHLPDGETPLVTP